jgi:hypothetical protein
MKPRRRLLATAWLLIAVFSTAAESKVISLWPDKPPGETAPLPPEIDVTVPTSGWLAMRSK